MESDAKLNQLKEQIESLQGLFLKTKKENEALLHEKMLLSQTIAEKEAVIIELETKYNTLHMAKSIAMEQGDNELAKKRLNGIVREIDKCIALLNK